jgi:hypothetical protein
MRGSSGVKTARQGAVENNVLHINSWVLIYRAVAQSQNGVKHPLRNHQNAWQHYLKMVGGV